LPSATLGEIRLSAMTSFTESETLGIERLITRNTQLLYPSAVETLATIDVETGVELLKH
jgi:hypothetical protein